jgi:hypothetical protein
MQSNQSLFNRVLKTYLKAKFLRLANKILKRSNDVGLVLIGIKIYYWKENVEAGERERETQKESATFICTGLY